MMRLIPALALAAFAGGCTMEDAPAPSPGARTDLATAIAGRTEGPAQACVPLRNIGGNRTVGDAILFGDNGRRIYVNRPAGGCPSLEWGRTLRVHVTTGQLCRGDIVTIVDLVSGAEYGGCGLGDFVPYDRP
jgi:hypothetical protein